MDIVVNLEPIVSFFSLPPDQMFWRFMILFGWLPLVWVFLYGAKEAWVFYLQNYKFNPTIKSILLAIDIPRANEQSPRAVENIFTYLCGANTSISMIDKYWIGKFQLGFSFEIVSIDGYTQFIIRTPIKLKNLVESAIYSQYPDAEITEVEDYAKDAPTNFPNDEYEVWGSEFYQPERHWVYPIKTYEEFEHSLGTEGVQFKDPMAALMDLCSSLVKGEQLWFQIIMKPQRTSWTEAGDKEIKKILGEKPKPTYANAFIDKTVELLGDFSEFIYSLWGQIEEKKKEEKDDLLKMMNLRPKEKKQIESIQRKVSKMGYLVKLRFVYLAKKELYNKPKVGYGFIGFMKQFTDFDLNTLKSDSEMTATSAYYLFKESIKDERKRRIMRRYKTRDFTGGRTPFILNTEELATIWHFPLESAVKAPMIQKTAGKKAEAPMTLPISEEIVSEEIMEPIFEEVNKTRRQDDNAKPPEEKSDNYWETEIMGMETKENSNYGNNNSQADTKGAPPTNLPIG